MNWTYDGDTGFYSGPDKLAILMQLLKMHLRICNLLANLSYDYNISVTTQTSSRLATLEPCIYKGQGWYIVNKRYSY